MYTVPTAAQFIARLPRFADVAPDIITDAIAEAASWVDDSWSEDDFALARMLCAAHSLTLDGHGAGAENEINAAGAAGFKSFRSGALSLDRGDKPASQWDQTSYGQRFAQLLRKNKGGPLVSSAPAGAG